MVRLSQAGNETGKYHHTGKYHNKPKMASDRLVDSSTNGKNAATGQNEIRVWMDGWYFFDNYSIIKPGTCLPFSAVSVPRDSSILLFAPCQNHTSISFRKNRA